jgi:hypothetical protein
MGACCAIPEAERPLTCPECGRTGRPLQHVTLEALLQPAALMRLQESSHNFCPLSECSVVYFGRCEVFHQRDLAVPVFQKEPQGRRTVCYCFAVTEDRIRLEVRDSGRSPSADLTKALVQAGRCACELRNPQGTCCLGNVTAVVRSASTVSEVSIAPRVTA